MNSNLDVEHAANHPPKIERRYLNYSGTAKLVRQSLREAFPGVKFSVRGKTYTGGASIDVNWEDGPCERQLAPIIGRFRGAYFDDMEDRNGHRFAGNPSASTR